MAKAPAPKKTDKTKVAAPAPVKRTEKFMADFTVFLVGYEPVVVRANQRDVAIEKAMTMLGAPKKLLRTATTSKPATKKTA